MKAVTWQGKRDVRVETVPDPKIEEPTDAVIRITSTGLCGSDLHLYQVLTPFMTPGDILGHEPMGIVEEVGAGVPDLMAGDRVVVPFQIACGNCWMCLNALPTQCETTQVTGEGMGAAIFGYTRLYGAVPGAQAEYLRVPQAQFGPIKLPEGPPDDRFVYVSDVLPTAWQAVAYADIPEGGSIAVLGLGPIGDMACRVAQVRGAGRVFGVDLVLCGHSHGYERSFYLNGHYGTSSTLTSTMIVDRGDGRPTGSGAYNRLATSNRGAVYVVAGSSGQASSAPYNHPAMYVSLARLGSLVVDVDGRQLNATFLDNNAVAADTFSIQHR